MLLLLLSGCILFGKYDTLPDTAADTGEAAPDSGETATGTSGTVTDTAGHTHAAGDHDGDGYVAGDDCDDANGQVHPGASEICNGFDDNCDGQVDESGASDWYADADGDGFGDGNNSARACEAPAGYTSNGIDCDDGSPSVYPGNSELCDGVDNDCDAEIDEGLTSTYYRDADSDGFGDPYWSESSCTSSAGWVANPADCDDNTPATYPGATEACDGLDNDCDGAIDDGC